jgi:ABC-type nitrate/sulfonate/bicarbonate transport system permease component
VALISPISVENTRIAPARIAGAASGTITRRIVVPQPAPQIFDASSSLGSICAIAADTERKTNATRRVK